MFHKPLKRILLVAALTFFLAFAAFSQELTVKEIMAEPSIAGMRVSGEVLSPDGKQVVFLWNAEGKYPLELYIVAAAGGTPRKWLSPSDVAPSRDDEEEDEKEEDELGYGVKVVDEFVESRRGGFGGFTWSPDSSKLLFTKGGDLYVIKIGETAAKRITKTQSAEFSARFIDNNRIVFQQSGNLFVMDTANGTLVQLSKEANSQRRISVFGGTLSKDGSMIAYSTSDASKQRPLYVPNYLPYYTAAPTFYRGWTKQSLFVTKTDGSQEDSIEVALPKPEGESYLYGLDWLSDHTTLIVDRVDKTHKRRQIFAVPVADGKASAFLIHEEEDEKWIGGPARVLEPDPKNADRFIFGSEKDGRHQIYLVDLERSGFADGKAAAGITQLTKTDPDNFPSRTVFWADWASDGRIVLMTTNFTTAVRIFTLISPDGRKPEVQIASDLPGMKTGAQLESDALIFERSMWNSPGEIYSVTNVLDAAASAKPVKLTSTTPAAFLARKWRTPAFSSVTARDGKQIYTKIYTPEGFRNADKRPLVVFVHGAGYLQNVINGWNNYYREFMFNQLLTQKGYVVLDIDYRGSSGYGRDWRTDVYDYLGGLDYTDHLDAIDFMTERFGTDPERVGVYGGSYGGFMAAMLVMRSPDKIKTAAALRPVMDWKNYYAANPFYTSQRLRSPKENPEGYKRSSPITYAEKLERKLLILHGLVDSNVHAQDSIQLVEKLIRLDKTEHFELMLYPSENHGFQRPTSWEDEYERILELFETELK